MAESPIEQQLIDLQERVAMQDYSLQKISDEFAAQQKELAILQQQVKYLADKLKNMSEAGGQISTAQERPPHY